MMKVIRMDGRQEKGRRTEERKVGGNKKNMKEGRKKEWQGMERK